MSDSGRYRPLPPPQSRTIGRAGRLDGDTGEATQDTLTIITGIRAQQQRLAVELERQIGQPRAERVSCERIGARR